MLTKNAPRTAGLVGVALLACFSVIIMHLPWMVHTGINSLVIAIILGIVIGNLWHYPASFSPGIQFSAKYLLRTAIILYGFRVSFQEIQSVGIMAILIDVCMVSLTLFVGYQIGKRLLKLDNELSLLISAGAAICGAAAVLAVEDVIKSEPYKASVAIGTVVLFGTLSMFLYPLLQHADVFGFTSHQFGVFAGASVHEVAQALVTGSDIDVETGKIAVIVKMMRVLLLVPVLISLPLLKLSGAKKNRRVTVPWFAVGFLAVIAFNSLRLLPASFIQQINQLDNFLLTMAMGAIGLETKWKKIQHVGLTPLYLALILFVWLMSTAFVLVKWA